MSTNNWLIRQHNPEAPVRLLCFPIAGVGATVYRNWPERVGDMEVCPVQLPGRENRMRERPFTVMEEFAESAAEALGPLLDRPYAVFGHCFGARLGHALIDAATSRGADAPQHFFASGCLAPHQGGRFGPFSPETTDDEYMADLRRTCKEQGEPEPPPELLGLAIRVLRADVEMSCGYAPAGPSGPPLDITTIGWHDDAHVGPDEMSEWAGYGHVQHVVLDGDESTFRTPPQELLNLLERSTRSR